MAMICNSIQSGSSSSQIVRKYYDVFVSFTGKDTRNNFTDHLFGALQRKGIPRDDKKLKKGQPIAPELLQAIEGSQVLVVVFSKNYASSTWCLRELVKILECVQVSGKHVLPIFYDVDPSEVRKQSGDYEKAFAEYEERFKEDLEKMEEVKGWREALTQVGNLSGWDVRVKSQYAEIEIIVAEIIRILGHKFSTLPKDLVGMQTPLEELEKLLLLDSVDDVRVVGICRMSGIGKTTLASVLYNKISRQYDACCFIHDVSKICRDHGPIDAQRQILHQTLNEENLQIWNPYNSTNLIQSRLLHVRALIVLDNVDHVEQLEKLAVSREWLGAGSKIIIVSTDKQILKVYGVDEVYEVSPLNWHDSIQLFCRKAFNCGDIVREYEDWTNDILEYADGHPLAIKVLGSSLFGRHVSEWKSALARLREKPTKDIMDILRLSFDGLEKNEKEIFLDIACFFNNGSFISKSYSNVTNVLNCCGFHADLGIRVLIGKSLISIRYKDVEVYGWILMHGLLQELGMKIVQEEPRKWSRLWLHDHFDNVTLENMEEKVEAVVLTPQNMEEMKTLMAETLSKMSHLRLLRLFGDTKFLGSLNCLSNELRYVEWFNYPFMYLPSTFHPNKLVELILKYSNIKQPWKGDKYLPNLKTLDLSHSKNLIKMPDFREVPNLERLNLEGCVKLVQVDPSIGSLGKLIFLNLKDCKSLVSISNNILDLSSLEYLNLSGCSKVFNNPMHAKYLKKLVTNETTLHSQSTFSFLKWITSPLHLWVPRAHKDSGSTSCLLPSLPNFSCLHELDLSFCGLSQVPDAIGSLFHLDKLNLGGNNFVTLPSLKELSKLVHLNLQHCKKLKSLPELPSPVNFSPRRQLVKDDIFSLPMARLFIFNCPKLGDKERCNSMIFSWMIQAIQANQESLDPLDGIEIVIPGSEIPRWFNNQNVGRSICIDSSPMMLDNNCIGVAFCVVVATHSDPTISSNEIKPCIGIGFQCKSGGIYAVIRVLLDRELVTVKSEHLWLFYFTRKFYLNMIGVIEHEKHDLCALKFAISAIKGQGVHLEVKNCGYHWVFKHDLELLNLTMMHGGNSLARKRKFLEIEDESQP